jgi:hypothetical protein
VSARENIVRAALLAGLGLASAGCPGEIDVPFFGDDDGSDASGDAGAGDGGPDASPDLRDDTDSDARDLGADRGPADAGDADGRDDAGHSDLRDADATADIADASLPDLVDLDAAFPDVDGGTTASGFTRYTDDRTLSPVTAGVVANLEAIYARSDDWQDDVFMKVGASGTVSTSFLQCFAGANVELAGRDHLEDTIAYFLAGDAAGSDPYTRETLAAVVGRSASWAIGGDPSPLEREIDAVAPRFAFVNYGTNDMQLAASFEAALFPFHDNYAELLDQLVDAGIVPIVTGILSRGDNASADLWVETYNAVIRGMAEARQVPFVDLHRATEALPDRGLSSDGLHASTYRPGGAPRACDFSAAGLEYGYNARNLISIEALDRVREPLLEGAAPPDAEALGYSGDGSPSAPFVIDRLPFTHVGDTATSPHDALNTYDGCSATQNEGGPELFYRLDLETERRLRFVVLDRGTVDVDLHLLDGAPTTAACAARAHQVIEGRLGPGTWYLSLDTFVNSGGTELSGEYLLVVTPCAAGDSTCDAAL